MAFSVNGYDISVTRYDYGVNLIWNIKNPNGSGFDLSDYQVQLIIKKEKYLDDADAIFNTVIDGSGSQIVIPLTEQMVNVPTDTYYYALRLIKDDTFVNTILQAKFIVSCNTFESEA